MAYWNNLHNMAKGYEMDMQHMPALRPFLCPRTLGQTLAQPAAWGIAEEATKSTAGYNLYANTHVPSPNTANLQTKTTIHQPVDGGRKRVGGEVQDDYRGTTANVY